MSYANYAHCEGCDGKTFYIGEDDVPDGVESWHEACRKKAAAEGAAAERDRIRQLALRHDATARTCPDGADCGHGNFHPFGPFADLLRELS